MAKTESNLVEDASLVDIDGDGKTIVFMEHIVSAFDVNAYVDEATAKAVLEVPPLPKINTFLPAREMLLWRISACIPIKSVL